MSQREDGEDEQISNTKARLQEMDEELKEIQQTLQNVYLKVVELGSRVTLTMKSIIDLSGAYVSTLASI